MKYRRIALFALCTALLLSGCNTDKSAVTTVAHETPTAEITTAVATTTIEITTTAEPKPEITLKAPTGEVTKTFGVWTEYRNNEQADEVVRSQFDLIFDADGEAYISVCSAPNSEFMATLRTKEDLSDAAELLEPYADGDMLINFMLRELPQTRLYHIFEDKPLVSCYRLNDDYLFCDSDSDNVTLIMKNTAFTAYRKAVELLWANYDSIKPLSVDAVYDVGLEKEQANANVRNCPYWLKISAPAETLDAIKKAFDENGIEKSIFEFVEDSDAKATSPEYKSRSLDNWELPGFIKPESWRELYTYEEALGHIDEIKNNGQGDFPEQTILWLMNRNDIAFHIGTWHIFDEIVWEDKDKNEAYSTGDIFKLSSPYISSLSDIEAFMKDTFTVEGAREQLVNIDGLPRYTEENGDIFTEWNTGITWNTNPFNCRTYIEIVDSDDKTITFNWHYIDWEYFDFSNTDRDFSTPLHEQMQFRAVKENGEWRLPMLIFDNPEFEKKAQTIDEDRLNDAISQLVNDDLYNRPDGETVLYGDDAWQLVKERCEIDFPLPDKILNGPKYLPGIERSQYCHDLYYDGTGFYSNSYYDAHAIVSGIVRYIGRIDGLNSENENVIILDENGHYWLYFQLDLDLNVKVGDTVEQFDVIGQTGSPGLYETIRYAFRVV
ncbi:MAG: M23 family metallopeptidase [Ruminiclostridium sp.]|nr:M23 family metallopeptidase [Ruminiclostridium sp.]